jgi:carbonic anhydrase
MKRFFLKNIIFSLVFLVVLNSCHTFGGGAMTRNEVQRMTPADAFKRLTEGYDRFQKDRLKNYRLDAQRYSTGRNGAFPPAIVLCSPDSRVAPELIYNQGLGDIYTLRAPATIVTQESLAGMEHACRDLGSKVIVVLCQTNDDFVAAAIDNNQSGNYPAVNAHFRDLIANIKRDPNWKRWKREEFMNIVTREHLMLNLERVRNLSPILRGMLERGEIMLVGGVYNIETGKIGYLNSADVDNR